MLHESRGRRAWLIVLLGSLTMFGALSTDMYLPAFPDVAADFGVSTADIPLTLTSFMFGMGLGQVLYGPLSDRFGRKPPLLVGLVVFIFASIMCATADSLTSLVIWRFVQALGGAAGIVVARAFVRDHFTGVDLARMMTQLGVVFALAPAFAPTIGAVVLHFASWQWVFIVLAAFGVYTLVGAVTLTESHPEDRRVKHGVADTARSYLEIFRHREFRFAVAAMMGGSAMLFGFVAASPAVMLEQYGLDSQAFAVLFGANSLAMVVASQINIRVLPRVGVRGVLMVSTRVSVVAAVVLMVAVLLDLPLAVLLVCTAVVTGTVSVLFGNGMTLALTPFGHRAGTATALLGLMQYLANGVTAGLLSQLPGSPAMHMAGAMLTGAVVSFAFVRRTTV